MKYLDAKKLTSSEVDQLTPTEALKINVDALINHDLSREQRKNALKLVVKYSETLNDLYQFIDDI